MSFESLSMTFTKNGTYETRQRFRLSIPKGVITKLQMHFPSGCAGLVFSRAFLGEKSLFPMTMSEWLRSDAETIQTEEFREVFEQPMWITVEGWNEDETYDHTLQVRVTILPKIVALPSEAFLEIRNALYLLLRRIGVFG